MTDRKKWLRRLALLIAPLLTAVLFTAGIAEEAAETPVFFGTWEQDGDPGNGPEPIRWRVLERQDGQALLLSETGLAAMPYHGRWREVTWETCDLREWLNDTFLREAFSEEERGAILMSALANPAKSGYETKGGADTEDRVFLLSFEEVSRYLPEAADRTARPAPPGVLARAHGTVWCGVRAWRCRGGCGGRRDARGGKSFEVYWKRHPFASDFCWIVPFFVVWIVLLFPFFPA